MKARRPLTVALATATVLAGGLFPVDGGAASAATPSAPTLSAATLVRDPAGEVDPLAGTGAAPVAPGNIGEFPGADVPFGMIQWSPDTTPNRTDGSGYSYADSRISGFSLTHMSGTGCASYGDVPILPTVGPLGSDPARASDRFSHAGEEASPGRYRVDLGASSTITAELSVTTRTGLSRFSFPPSDSAHVLFKVADSANGASRSSYRVTGDDEIDGQVTSGQFCGTGTDYTLYFTARFDRHFSTAGGWAGGVVTPGRRSCSGRSCGAYVSFDTESDRVVLMKVGISFVSVADATANLDAEDPGWSLARVESAARQRWNALLGRIRIGGGTVAAERTFYTALYHSLLHPNVVSDVNGRYQGTDGQVHRSGRPVYANFSEWDIYRGEFQLVSLLAPGPAGAMVQSLVDDAQQDGWLPKWAIVGGDASQMNGDSADPIIADAYAFGVRGFDAGAALGAMVKGATQNEPLQGLEIERQYLSQYLSQHYVDAGSLDLDSINYSDGGSATLEYAIDDFSIAQLAGALGDGSVEATMMARGHNWEYLFDPATGFIQARNADGSFPEGPAFRTSLLEAGGQVGFEEGNAIQYTWSVPQDLAALSGLMGGDARMVATLNTFFSHLNAGRSRPYDWAGNEPSLWTPWEYDYVGAPWRTEDVVRRIATTLYSDRPDDEPGNDDLGAMSSWYVWAALGLYPVTPGSADLALASPLFPRAVVTLPDNRTLVLRAPQASATTPYIHSLTVTGVRKPPSAPSCGSGATASGGSRSGNWNRPWLPASVITTGGTLSYGLSAVPDRSWGTAPSDSPPSFAAGRVPAVAYSRPSGGVSVPVGRPATVALGMREVPGADTTVDWSAGSVSGLTLSPPSGTLAVSAAGPAGCSGASSPPQTLTVEASRPGSFTVVVDMETATGTALPPVVLDLVAST